MRDQDNAFGGKLECRLVPLRESLMYLSWFSAVHSPFHPRSLSALSSSCISGSQNPESYSRPSISIECLSRSSRVLEGRPLLRSFRRCASSSSLRERYLILVRMQSRIPRSSSLPLHQFMDLVDSNGAFSIFRGALEECYPLYCVVLIKRLPPVLIHHTMRLIGFGPSCCEFLQFFRSCACSAKFLGISALLMQTVRSISSFFREPFLYLGKLRHCEDS